MALQESWHIRSRARQCAITEKPFEEGQQIVTALFPDPESSGYLRRDFSLEAWEARGEEDESAFSFWRSTYEPPAQDEKVDPMEKEDPETLLRRLVDEDEEHTENVRYILAVMLERKKLLRETDAQTIPTGTLRVYEHRKTGDAFLIRDPNIPLDEVESVQEEVILLLEHGGRIPEPEAEAEGEEEDPGEADSPEEETDAGPQDGDDSEEEEEDEKRD
ncbi:hypothetical protein [Haloferula sp. A504]|uniref:hypothetical protein n=1 Tax=Haloferula sp. A504 TaxID=3373601 RepID=UPI0031C79351|nr:hypothetical protein [Verrucomicrobiaceae bacterium E54]